MLCCKHSGSRAKSLQGGAKRRNRALFGVALSEWVAAIAKKYFESNISYRIPRVSKEYGNFLFNLKCIEL